MAKRKRGKSRSRNGNRNGSRKGLKLLGGGDDGMDSMFGIGKSGVNNFFSGIQNGDLRRSAGVGVKLPELGEGFNSRFGQIGSGFVERVDPDKFGFSGGVGRSGGLGGRGRKEGSLLSGIGSIGSNINVLGGGGRGKGRRRKATRVSVVAATKGTSIIDKLRERRAKKKERAESKLTTSLEEVPKGESPIRALPSLEDISEDDMEKEMDAELEDEEEEEEEPVRTGITRGTLTDEEAREQGILR